MMNYKHLSWLEIASYFQDRTHIQCMHRWQKVLQPGLKKGKWSEEEDKILISWVKKHGPNNWAKLTLALRGRSSKQIRDRWVNNLNPQRAKHFVWNDELDRILLIKYMEFGSSWVQISKFIPNSTENMIKNRFYCLLRSIAAKKNKKCGKKSIKNEQEEYNQKQKEFEEFLVFDFEDDKNKSETVKDNVKNKRKNYSLTYLVNFLPDLLEEKGVDLNSSNIKKDNNYDEDRKRILNNFFNTLSNKITPAPIDNCEPSLPYETKASYNLENEVSKKNAQLKFKSTILLNFQLHLLHRIFERCKLQIINRFFQYFKGNGHINGLPIGVDSKASTSQN